MNDPYRWEDQPAEKRVDFGEQEMHQGRGPSPTTWRLIDAIVCAIGFGLIVWIVQGATS